MTKDGIISIDLIEDGECYSSPGKGVDSPVVYRNCSLEMTAMSSDVQQSGSGSSINKDRGGCTDGIVTESGMLTKIYLTELPVLGCSYKRGTIRT